MPRAARPVSHAPVKPFAAPVIARPSPAEISDTFTPHTSRKPLWVGLGAGAIGITILAIWALSGHEPEKAPPPVVTKG